jgi:nucleotide-binding universal stress UspA family protein
MKDSPFKYERILVPLDGSALAEQALVPALVIAEAMAAEIQCLQVITGLTLNVDPKLNQKIIEARENAANLYLDSLRNRFSKTKAIIETAMVVGPAARTIVNFAKDRQIDLIVLSSHGYTGLKQWVYGNVAIKILRRSPCDTLLVRPFTSVEPFSKKRILVPLDGSQLAERALKPAAALATALDMDILLLRVLPPIYSELEPMSAQYMFNNIEAKERDEARAYLQDIKTKLAPLHRPITIEIMAGTPAATILEVATKQQVDMIIMCSHGRTGPGLWLMGSVAEKVLRRASCATLVVRPS